ncbi:hypothetical protein OAP14_02625 [Aliiglaciecola sp.]|nr:hypothetical protein [Aliiglaciecola sp.]
MMVNERENYVPNQVSRSKRLFNLLWAFLLSIWGGHGYLTGTLWLPSLRGASGLQYTNTSLSLMMVAIVLGCLNLIVPIVDHYDKRDNEHVYTNIEKILSISSVILIVTATAMAHGYM